VVSVLIGLAMLVRITWQTKNVRTDRRS
jgi:hypothetical protein